MWAARSSRLSCVSCRWPRKRSTHPSLSKSTKLQPQLMWGKREVPGRAWAATSSKTPPRCCGTAPASAPSRQSGKSPASRRYRNQHSLPPCWPDSGPERQKANPTRQGLFGKVARAVVFPEVSSCGPHRLVRRYPCPHRGHSPRADHPHPRSYA